MSEHPSQNPSKNSSKKPSEAQMVPEIQITEPEDRMDFQEPLEVPMLPESKESSVSQGPPKPQQSEKSLTSQQGPPESQQSQKSLKDQGPPEPQQSQKSLKDQGPPEPQQSQKSLKDQGPPETQQSQKSLKDQGPPETQQSQKSLKDQGPPEPQQSQKSLKDQGPPETQQSQKSLKDQGPPETQQSQKSLKEQRPPKSKQSVKHVRSQGALSPTEPLSPPQEPLDIREFLEPEEGDIANSEEAPSEGLEDDSIVKQHVTLVEPKVSDAEANRRAQRVPSSRRATVYYPPVDEYGRRTSISESTSTASSGTVVKDREEKMTMVNWDESQASVSVGTGSASEHTAIGEAPTAEDPCVAVAGPSTRAGSSRAVPERTQHGGMIGKVCDWTRNVSDGLYIAFDVVTGLESDCNACDQPQEGPEEPDLFLYMYDLIADAITAAVAMSSGSQNNNQSGDALPRTPEPEPPISVEGGKEGQLPEITADPKGQGSPDSAPGQVLMPIMYEPEDGSEHEDEFEDAVATLEDPTPLDDAPPLVIPGSENGLALAENQAVDNADRMEDPLFEDAAEFPIPEDGVVESKTEEHEDGPAE